MPCACNLRTLEAETEGSCDFEASPGYTVTSKTACIHSETRLKINSKNRVKKENKEKNSHLCQHFQEEVKPRDGESSFALLLTLTPFQAPLTHGNKQERKLQEIAMVYVSLISEKGGTANECGSNRINYIEKILQNMEKIKSKALPFIIYKSELHMN
jgi:hypothetical protein